MATKKAESGPSSVFHLSPEEPAARPSFHGSQFQPPLPGPLQPLAPPTLGSWLAHWRTGATTVKPRPAISALAPERATVRLALVDSTEPVSGTQTGAGPESPFAGCTKKARLMPACGKSVLRPSLTW